MNLGLKEAEAEAQAKKNAVLSDQIHADGEKVVEERTQLESDRAGPRRGSKAVLREIEKFEADMREREEKLAKRRRTSTRRSSRTSS